MIDLTGMISIPYLKKTTFTGSEKGTNFMIRKIIHIDEEKCTGCGLCTQVCPFGVIAPACLPA